MAGYRDFCGAEIFYTLWYYSRKDNESKVRIQDETLAIAATIFFYQINSGHWNRDNPGRLSL